MSSKKNSIKIIRAVSALSNKLSRFKSSNPNAEPDRPLRADEIRQKKVDYFEEDFKLAVAGNYRKYRFPYKTLGSNSSVADALIKDEERLLSAYNLFKAVKEANAQFSKYETFIVDNVITTPLNAMEQYTTGDEFIYLQSWLYFEKKVRDYIPFMNVNSDGSYRLQFVPASDYRWNHTDKEIFAVIRQNFYPTEQL
ncbi:MAG: hypothetical protein K6G00_12730 [Treponema sp.]|nr:hypothetical protein [Treponema sp.]